MHACCSRGRPAAPTIGAGGSTWTRRTLWFAEWALPITALALVPKCPACFAGYILLFTGIGLSISAAAAMRWTVIGACIVVLVWLLSKAAARLTRSRRNSHRRAGQPPS